MRFLALLLVLTGCRAPGARQPPIPERVLGACDAATQRARAELRALAGELPSDGCPSLRDLELEHCPICYPPPEGEPCREQELIAGAVQRLSIVLYRFGGDCLGIPAKERVAGNALQVAELAMEELHLSEDSPYAQQQARVQRALEETREECLDILVPPDLAEWMRCEDEATHPPTPPP